MGAVCCVAAKDRTIVNRQSGNIVPRHVRHSPSWSFRRDNRGRVAGEEMQANWLHGGGRGNAQVEVKSGSPMESAFALENGSPLNSLPSLPQKPLISDANASILRPPYSDGAISRNPLGVKKLAQTPSASHPSHVNPSSSGPSVSTPPRIPRNLTPSRCYRDSPNHQLYKSSTFSISGKASYESTRDSNGGSSDSWPIPVFSDLTTMRRQRWSFDSEGSEFGLEDISSSERNAASPIAIQNCSACTKLLTERSSWGWTTRKSLSADELAVVSVLACGHVYHAECLEYLTPEINKYDPACLVCAHGDKWAMKISEKLLKSELVAKARKRSKKCWVDDSDRKSNIWSDQHESGGVEEQGLKIKSSLGKPFLKRHFSFSSKSGRSSPENHSAKRKGLFWSRSGKR